MNSEYVHHPGVGRRKTLFQVAAGIVLQDRSKSRYIPNLYYELVRVCAAKNVERIMKSLDFRNGGE